MAAIFSVKLTGIELFAGLALFYSSCTLLHCDPATAAAAAILVDDFQFADAGVETPSGSFGLLLRAIV